MFTCKGVLRTRLSDANLVSKTGNPYRMGQYLFDMDDQKGAWISFKTFGDINDKLVEGNHYEIVFSMSSREYNSKYYTDFLVESANALEVVVEEKDAIEAWMNEPDKNPDDQYTSGPPTVNPFLPKDGVDPTSDLPF